MIYKHTCIRMCTHTGTHTRMHVHTYIHTYTDLKTHIYIHRLKDTHTRTQHTHTDSHTTPWRVYFSEYH